MCNRNDGGIQNNDDFNNTYFAYQTDLASKLRSSSTCLGSGSGNGVSCSTYTQGAPRKTVSDIGDPVLLHRSNISSACPPSRLNSYAEDTLSTPIDLSPEQLHSMNKGVGLFGYQTRSVATTSQLTEYDMSPYHLSLPDRWPTQYQGYTQGIPGTNTPSRMMARDSANAKYKDFKNSGPSLRSYGSYGLA
jgi:hypothetical protein